MNIKFTGNISSQSVFFLVKPACTFNVYQTTVIFLLFTLKMLWWEVCQKCVTSFVLYFSGKLSKSRLNLILIKIPLQLRNIYDRSSCFQFLLLICQDKCLDVKVFCTHRYSCFLGLSNDICNNMELNFPFSNFRY